MRLGLIINPSSGRGKGEARGALVIETLDALGQDFLNLSGQSMDEANANARHAINDNLIEGLVVVGGDGIAHLGVNIACDTGISLGIVAAGTGNDLARSLGLPEGDVVAATKAVVAKLSNPRKVDAIKAHSSTGQFWFFGTASAGFDALVNQRANRMSWPKGRRRYDIAMVLELAKFKPIHYEATIDGEHRSFDAMLCAIANGPAFGGGMLIAPDAKIDDGYLDLFIVHSISRPELLKVFPKVYTGRHVSHPAVEFVRAKSVKLSSGNMPVYSDGEARGHSPLTSTVVPGALSVFA
ncbi:MAG: diacylglycerol/lipid kinase family protein [Rhodoluna sp.]